MNHSVKGRRQALHQTHHHYYLNVSVQAANLSDWRIESKKIDSVARIESNRNFFARIGMLYSRAHVKIASRIVSYRTLRTSGFMELCRQRPGV